MLLTRHAGEQESAAAKGIHKIVQKQVTTRGLAQIGIKRNHKSHTLPVAARTWQVIVSEKVVKLNAASCFV